MAELAEGATDEMGTEAGFHANDARWQLSERLDQRQPPDLAPERDLAVSAKANEVEDFLADVMPIEARGAIVLSMACFSG